MIVSVFLVAASYLFGSVPFGLLISKTLRGIDPRAGGSGNIGFTNVLRLAGKVPAVLTLFGDVGKGVLPPLIMGRFIPQEEWIFAAGLAAFLGHTYPLYLKFQGGKGVATGFGVLLALWPSVAALGAGLWIVTVLVTRYVSVGSLVAFGFLPAIVWVVHQRLLPLLVALVVGGVVCLRHWDNLLRLKEGTEPRIGQDR